MRALWEKYFAEAHGVIFVVDACSAERLAEARGALDGVARHPELDAHAPVVVLANKQDRPGALSADEVAAALGLVGDAGALRPPRSTQPLRILPTSALTLDGIQEAMQWVVYEAKRLARSQPIAPPGVAPIRSAV